MMNVDIFTREAVWLELLRAGWMSVRGAVAVAPVVLEPVSNTADAWRAWLCWIKAVESGVSCRRAGRLL